MRAKFAYPIALLAAWLFCSPVFAAGYMTLEFHESETRPKKVLVLPVQAQLTIVRVGQNEPVIAESDGWEKSTHALLISGLEERGYQVQVLEPEVIAADQQLQELVNDVNDEFAEHHPKFARKRNDIVERRFNIGRSARTLAQRQGVDALVIARVAASAQAGGALAMRVLVGGVPSMTLMNLTVVDAGTGDVEAYLFGSGGPVNIEKMKAADSAIIQKMVKRSLKKYPASDKNVRIGKKTKARAVAKSVPEVEDDDMLSELEDLIGGTE